MNTTDIAIALLAAFLGLAVGALVAHPEAGGIVGAVVGLGFLAMGYKLTEGGWY